MSKLSGYLYHPINKHPEPIYSGFSWPCFFVSTIWYACKGVWNYAVITGVLNIMTGGFAGIFFAFSANDHHRNHLLSKGYLNEEQIK